MKKKIVFLFILLFGVFFNVEAAMPSRTRMNGKVRLSYVIAKPVNSGGYHIYAYAKTVTDGGYIYCIEPNKDTMENGSYLDLVGELTDPGYIYLAKNGFPNSRPLEIGDDNQNYYVTQMAHWIYAYKVYGLKNGTQIIGSIIDENANLIDRYDNDNPTSVNIVNAAYALYQGALAAHNSGSSGNELTISASSTSNVMTKDNDNLYTGEVTVTLSGSGSYTVTVNNTNATVIDLNGNPKSTFSKSEKFKVKVSDVNVTNLTVTIQAENTIDKVYRYSPTSSNEQDVLYTVMESTPNSKNTRLSFTYEPENSKLVEISKSDITTGEELPGAKLVLKNSENVVVDEWTSTAETHKVYLLPGTYTLSETIAPEGYILSQETVTFTVTEEGVSGKVEMKNYPIGETIISKVDAGAGNELPGAYLEIHDSNGQLVESWISTDTPHKVKLNPGTYTLTETKAPAGYKLSKETVSFKVDEDGKAYSVVMKNEVEVPMTSLDRNTIILIVSLIAGMVGIGILAYVNHLRGKSLA